MGWSGAAYLYAAIVAGGFGYVLLRMPFQVSDNLGNMLTLDRSTLAEILFSQSSSSGFMRPLLWVQLKVIFDLAGGKEFVVFRLFQTIQLLVVLLLTIRLLAVRTILDFTLVPLTIAMVTGSHTFGPTVREAFPVNTFLTVLVCCLASVNLAASRPRWWKDGLALFLLVYAGLSVETGLLVWVCLVTGFIVGLRGVSFKGVAGSTGLLLLYLYLRFFYLDVGAPDLLERSTGVGFAVLDPHQIVERFAGREPWLYAYNITCAMLSVLFAEPRAGVWVLVRAVVMDHMRPWMVIGVVSSCVTTMIVAHFVVRRWTCWRSVRLGHGDRMCLIAIAVLVANAVISYPYTKDVVMSPAGVFYAIAAYFAVRSVVSTTIASTGAVRTVALCLVLTVVSVGWTVRMMALPYGMRQTAFKNRNDWVSVHDWLDEQRIPYDRPRSWALVGRLRSEALAMDVPNPHFLMRGDDVFDQQ